MQPERRYIPVNDDDVCLRSEEGKNPIMFGHAAVFNSMSENLGGFRELIEPGFFRNAIKPEKLRVYSLFNHDPNEVLGYSRSKPTPEVVVREDKKGLYQETELKGDTTTSSNMIAHVRAGRIEKMSFAFTVELGGETWEVKGNTNIRKLQPDGCRDLYDVSPVVYPAYRGTDLGIRSSLPGTEQEIESLMVALVRCEKDLPATRDDVATIKEFNKRIVAWCERHAGPGADVLELSAAKERIARLLA